MSSTVKLYNHFVKASDNKKVENISPINLTGEQAKQIYVEEVCDIKSDISVIEDDTAFCTYTQKSYKKSKSKEPVTEKHLFTAVQNNDLETVKSTLKVHPKKVNIKDDYGWSLLMIACQADLVNMVKLLLDFGADVSITDKAGNTAQRLITQNKNNQIADLLLNKKHFGNSSCKETKKSKSVAKKELFVCDTCKSTFSNKDQHLSSTVHNLNTSKALKLPNCYKIPESNKGFQIMLKDGWNKDSGLGVEGAGIKYPVKAVEKKDRKGLGHKIKKSQTEVHEKQTLKKLIMKDYKRSKTFEINFRREFY